MSQLTKQQLKGENQTQFPNNNVGAITPSHLRAFNVDMIDSTVNQTDFTNFSGSVAGEFASLTASVDPSITGSSLVTASFDNGTRNLTFTKGDASTFAVNIPDVSGSTGNFATTGSNTFTGNQTINAELSISQSKYLRIGDNQSIGTPFGNSLVIESQGGNIIRNLAGGGDITLQNTQGNVNISGSATSIQNVNFIPFSQSVDARINAITGSGGSIDTGSFATTGSNTFTGNQTMIALSMSGSILFPNGANIGPNSVGQATLISSQTALQISSSVNSTYTAQTLTLTSSTATNINSVNTNTLTAPRTDIRGVETIGDIPATGNGDVYLLGRSGSLILGNSTASPTYAALSHLSSSQINANTNLIFKTNNNVASTEISGSNNIFINPGAPTTNFVRYVGGSGNLYLHSNGVPQITASAASISGNRPIMSGNILGIGTIWNINQAVNPSSHTYSNNMIEGGTLTFNMLGNTGQVSFNNNILAAPNWTINSPSRSIAQIQAGESGSTTLTISSNMGSGTLTYQGPVSSSGAHSVTTNTLNGTLILNVQSGSKGVNVGNNSINGTLQFFANTTDIRSIDLGTGNNTNIQNNTFNGSAVVSNSGPSRVTFSNNNILGAVFVESYYTASAVTVANVRGWSVQRNIIGGTSPYILISGSADGTYGTIRLVQDNIIFGDAITASVVGDSSKNLASTAIIGRGLNVYGTSVSITSSIGLTNYGSAFFGRYNAEDGSRAQSAETIFAVGTGNSGSAGITRKTGFLIDSGSNTFIEGTLNVSGSTRMTGSLFIQSGSTLPVSTGSAILTWDATTGQVNQASYSTIISASLSSAEFWSTITQSGSAGVSGSLSFNNSGSFYNVSVVNGTQLTVTNAGVYNIQFSAQLETSAGADTIYVWFKKNGNNIGASASKAVLANNTAQIMTVNILDEAQANDYYEIAYQNINGHATILAEAASGNIPAIPSVIATVIQVR